MPVPLAMSSIVTRQLDCGAMLVVERMPSVASVALNWLLPAGCATDPEPDDGVAAMLSEMVFRGAGGLSSREHSDALDRQGVSRDSHVHAYHLRLTATLLGERLSGALPLLAAMITAPAFPEDAMEAVRSLCVQSLEGLQDDPQHLVMLRLREQHLPAPFNRHGYGRLDALDRCTVEDLRSAWEQRCRPSGAILAAAGAVDPGKLARQMNRLLATWSGSAEEPVEASPPRRGTVHIAQETAQVHLGVAWDAPSERAPESIVERLAITVLSGGTSARLFSEVRQKRSLCYSVGASYEAGRDRGLVTLYAGTTPARARETLDVCLQEIRRLRQGATQEEFDRAMVGIRSGIVMNGEATTARASALGLDQFRIGRPRTLQERLAEYDAVTLGQLNDYLVGREIGELTVATLGPEALAP